MYHDAMEYRFTLYGSWWQTDSPWTFREGYRRRVLSVHQQPATNTSQVKTDFVSFASPRLQAALTAC
jgi:hypothetical protein